MLKFVKSSTSLLLQAVSSRMNEKKSTNWKRYINSTLYEKELVVQYIEIGFPFCLVVFFSPSQNENYNYKL